MPELPEVETIRRGLEKSLVGKTIGCLKVLEMKSIKSENYCKIYGQKVVKLLRFGKLLVINLSEGDSLMVHLRMTGQLVYQKEDINNQSLKSSWGGGHPTDSLIKKLPDNSTRIILEFKSDGKTRELLYFNDQRKFGFLDVVPTSELMNVKFIKELGPEPPHKVEEFCKKIRRHQKVMIKPAILDQKNVAGIGNIYADEALWMTRIHPETKVMFIEDMELIKLYQNAAEVMELSIEKGGSTSRNYVNALGQKGAYLDFANVFRREGKKCKRCLEGIIKIRVGGRGTHLCPKCQEVKGE